MSVRSQNRLPAVAIAARALTLCFISSAALAGPGTQTEDDLYVGKKRQVQGVTAPTTTGVKPPLGAGTSPNTARSAAPRPAGQTTTPMVGTTQPGTATPQLRPGAGTSPNTATLKAKTTARAGGDEDLEELEVERRKVQGVNAPSTTQLPPRAGPGTSPNTGRSAAPLPAGLPGKPL